MHLTTSWEITSAIGVHAVAADTVTATTANGRRHGDGRRADDRRRRAQIGGT